MQPPWAGMGVKEDDVIMLVAAYGYGCNGAAGLRHGTWRQLLTLDHACGSTDAHKLSRCTSCEKRVVR